VPRSIARSRVDEGGPSYRDSLNLIRSIHWKARKIASQDIHTLPSKKEKRIGTEQ